MGFIADFRGLFRFEKCALDEVGNVLAGVDFITECMGVYARRDLRGSVADLTGNVCQGYTRMKRSGHVGMPLRYNYDKPEKPRISRVFGYQARFFILFQPEKSSREVVIS